MTKNLKKLYNRLVESEIGERIHTTMENGIDYKGSLKDALKQQGYTENEDYKTGFDYKTYRTFVIKLKPIQPPQEILHDIQAGDIFYNSWGWEQTNIDFFQVIAATKKTVRIRKLNRNCKFNNTFLSGKTTAIKDDFCSEEVITKKPYFFDGDWRLSFDHGSGCKWDGSELDYTSYA